jgi:hypothetical protein
MRSGEGHVRKTLLLQSSQIARNSGCPIAVSSASLPKSSGSSTKVRLTKIRRLTFEPYLFAAFLLAAPGIASIAHFWNSS